MCFPDRVTRFQETERKVKVLFAEDLERLLSAPDTNTREEARQGDSGDILFYRFASRRAAVAQRQRYQRENPRDQYPWKARQDPCGLSLR